MVVGWSEFVEPFAAMHMDGENHIGHAINVNFHRCRPKVYCKILQINFYCIARKGFSTRHTLPGTF